MAWTSPKTWAANDVLTAADLNTHVRDNLKAASEWTTYSPTWTATGGTPTVGDGTLDGRYILVGNLMHFRLVLVWGSTSAAAGTTLWTFTLPGGTSFAGPENQMAATAYDSSVNGVAMGYAYSNTTTSFQAIFTGTGQRLGLSLPFSWATGDRFQVTGTIEVS